MFARRVPCVVAIVIAAASVAGCASQQELKGRFTGRWGPNPAIQADDVNSVVSGQWQVLSFIAGEGRIDGFDKDKLDAMPTGGWFRIAEWGFNIGRQDCEIYMDNLFRMSRERQRNDTILTGLSTAAAAILTGTTQSQKALSVLAAAFGLSIILNDSIYQSYLFTEAPGLVAVKVKELQDTYREDVEKDPSLINTPDQAYKVIQNYYNICLPQSIEGALLQAVSNTSAKMPKSKGNKSNPAARSPVLTP
jgi:hypothetical protein